MEEKLAEAREKAKSVAGVCVTSSNGQNIEINHPEAQKGIAVEFFARLHGIPMERVMVLGDQFNDLSMMKRAGVSVAMGNAEEEVKKPAVMSHAPMMNTGWPTRFKPGPALKRWYRGKLFVGRNTVS